MPEGAVYVGRPTIYGNPFKGATACILFEALLSGFVVDDHELTKDAQLSIRKRILDNIKELKGKKLACWCALNAPCHADTLCEIANNEGTKLLSSLKMRKAGIIQS